MSPEMFVGFGLSALVVMMLGKSPEPKPKTPKRTTVTFVLPDCDNEGLILKEIQEARLE
ncbi:MAG: hypothetical protein AAFO59_00605 [Cyanobacteria bacterium J06607_17]